MASRSSAGASPCRPPAAALPCRFPGVIGAPHEGAAHDLPEPEPERQLPQLRELLGREVAGDGELAGGRTEVLAQGDDPAAVVAQVGEDVLDLRALLPE